MPIFLPNFVHSQEKFKVLALFMNVILRHLKESGDLLNQGSIKTDDTTMSKYHKMFFLGIFLNFEHAVKNLEFKNPHCVIRSTTF